ncbi:hypothetical protein QQZ08_003780 [Neonectria magnoliae]|uniref:Uncharacterized protein n=1 Tax=Neonectria magnoliae TaxID=2732573 RepID=A0ABR1I9Q2_9HYPO
MVDFLWPGWGPLCTILTAIGLPFVILSTVLMCVHLFLPFVLPSTPSSATADRNAERIANAAERTVYEQRRLREVSREAVSLLTTIVATEQQESQAARIRQDQLLIAHRVTRRAIHDLTTALQPDGLENDREIVSLTLALANLRIN